MRFDSILSIAWILTVGNAAGATCPNATSFVKPVIDDSSRGFVWGVPSNGFGNYLSQYGGFHPGEDWSILNEPGQALGQPVYPSAVGTVVAVSNLNTLGYVVVIQHTGNFNIPTSSGSSNGQSYSYPAETVTTLQSIYMHLINVQVQVNDCVQPGATILGYIMNPGAGPHVHFEIRDPSAAAAHSRNWSLVLPMDNWSIDSTGAYDGYYLNLQRMANVGLRRPSSILTTQSNQGSASVMTSPVQGSTLSGAAVTFQWTASGAIEYFLYVGSNGTESEDIYGQNQGTSTSFTLNGLPTDGRTLYVTLWSHLSDGWHPNNYTYTTARIGTVPVPASMTFPASGSTLSGSSEAFQWNTGTSIQGYYLYVGNSAGAQDIYSQTQGTNLSGTVANLPTDGRMLYVTLWSYTTSDNWLPENYTYKAAGIGAGQIAGHLSISFSPNPVTKSSDGAWYYTVYVQETAGTAVNLTQMSIGGADYSSDIATWFGKTTVPAHGQISVGIKSTGNSGPLLWQVSGGGQSWSGSITLE
ncbi:MAG TPA: M23 family metallopeptidase [Bryobacteraceae bacterium]|nr:M23 family metallopeptidase [Bryobacteraceae bacterium]